MAVAEVSTLSLVDKAQECLDKKADIPKAPLWHMARAAKNNSSKNLKVLQNAVDYLTCKARAKMEFTKREKEFLKEVYEAFWWGGKAKGFKEAAKLANHYVNGDGKTIKINSAVYEESKIVQLTMDAMKQFINAEISKNMSITTINSSNARFLQKPYAIKLRTLNQKINGKLDHNGVLMAEQSNLRMKKADHKFVLLSNSVKMPQSGIKTQWSVKSTYDFKPFEPENNVSEIPLGEGKLYLPDGLSQYMTQIGVAKVFIHHTSWSEIWV